MLRGWLWAGALALACACGNGTPGTDGQGGGETTAATSPVRTAANVAPAVAAAPRLHRVFDLGHNRALAHWQRDRGMLVLAGTGGLAKYLWPGRGARKLPRPIVRDGEAATIPGRMLRLDLPLTADQAAAARVVSMRLHATRRTAVTVALGKRDRPRRVRRVVPLVPGWQVIEMAVPPGTAVAGENSLRLRFRDHGVAVAWIQIAASGGQGPAPRVYDDEANALVLARGVAVSFLVWVPDSASLRARVSDGCEVAVAARGRDASVVGVLRGELDRVSLAPLSGQVVRLTFRSTECDSATVADAGLEVPGAPPSVVRGPPPKNVVLWVMDTLRADRVRAIDPKARAETPVMQRLAKTGTVFRSYYVEGNESQTSHSSLFTSVYPAIHRVITAGPRVNYRLSPKFDAIAPLLATAGFQTVGVTANGNVHSWTGYRRGFQVFNNIMRDGTGRRNRGYVPGSTVYKRTLAKLGTIDVHKPFFLFIGTVDTHKPWVGHQPWLDRYDPKPYRGRFKTRADNRSLEVIPGTHLCVARLSRRDKARIFALYDTNVSFQDALVGRFLEQLETWGIRDETMVIVTADHGEELWEYGRRCGHGSSLRESLVRVPLVIHYPPMFPRSVVNVGADGVDVLPTILDALGRAPISQAQGQSLVGLAHGVGAGYPRPAYASMNEMAHTMRLGQLKMWVGMSGVPALYDVSVDPDERTNMVSKRPLEARFLRDALVTFLAHRARWHKSAWGVASNMTAAGARALEPRETR